MRVCLSVVGGILLLTQVAFGVSFCVLDLALELPSVRGGWNPLAVGNSEAQFRRLAPLAVEGYPWRFEAQAHPAVGTVWVETTTNLVILVYGKVALVGVPLSSTSEGGPLLQFTEVPLPAVVTDPGFFGRFRSAAPTPEQGVAFARWFTLTVTPAALEVKLGHLRQRLKERDLLPAEMEDLVRTMARYDRVPEQSPFRLANYGDRLIQLQVAHATKFQENEAGVPMPAGWHPRRFMIHVHLRLNENNASEWVNGLSQKLELPPPASEPFLRHQLMSTEEFVTSDAFRGEGDSREQVVIPQEVIDEELALIAHLVGGIPESDGNQIADIFPPSKGALAFDEDPAQLAASAQTMLFLQRLITHGGLTTTPRGR